MSNSPAPRRSFLRRLAGFAGLSAAAGATSAAQGQAGSATEPGATQEVFNSPGPGVITHIWFTISAPSQAHLKEIVIRGYWDGNAKPSIEVPVGDFFGLNLGQYSIYQSAFLNCSSIKALNCYFSMPFRRSAKWCDLRVLGLRWKGLGGACAPAFN